MEVAGLILGIIGTISGLLSLGWNIISHSLTGIRINATFRAGFVLVDENEPERSGVPKVENVYLTDLETFSDIDSFEAEGQSATAVLALEVHNVGRLPVRVTDWAVYLGDVGNRSRRFNIDIPHSLGVGESIALYIEIHSLAMASAMVEKTSSGLARGKATIRGLVFLGNGTTVKTRNDITLGALKATPDTGRYPVRLGREDPKA
jgi:hypothetical protein